MSTGVVTDACYPYTSGAGRTAACSRSCTGTGAWKKHFANSHHTFGSVSAIK